MERGDWVALGVFLACWLTYGPLLTGVAGRIGALNADMQRVRAAWMRVMAVREVRLLDSQLLGHSINSASFFASANLLLIAAVAGVLFGGESALQNVAAVGIERSPERLLEIKLGLVTLCLARGLLDFIWSIRQLNYTVALIGAAPEAEDPQSPARREAFAEAATAVLNPALEAFNRGVRAYYFSLAAAAWLFGPLWLGLAAATAFVLLLWRQSRSPAARGVRRAVALLGE
jgi:uncharacterized membrane protein